MSELLQIIFLIAAVVVGGLFVQLMDAIKQKKLIKILLAFSGGFLLAIAFAHFLPELYHEHESEIGIFVLLGFLIQLFLEYFSGGIEHGHVHHEKGHSVPWVLFISLSVHSLLEGVPLSNPVEYHHGHNHGSNPLLLGIILHQIPVAIALMTVFKNKQIGKRLSWMMLLLFSFMTPLGLLVGMMENAVFTGINMNYLLAVVMGMFLHISTTIIFETNENHKFNIIKLTSILCGVILALWLK